MPTKFMTKNQALLICKLLCDILAEYCTGSERRDTSIRAFMTFGLDALRGKLDLSDAKVWQKFSRLRTRSGGSPSALSVFCEQIETTYPLMIGLKGHKTGKLFSRE